VPLIIYVPFQYLTLSYEEESWNYLICKSMIVLVEWISD
jgi:hypothetical protein